MVAPAAPDEPDTSVALDAVVEEPAQTLAHPADTSDGDIHDQKKGLSGDISMNLDKILQSLEYILHKNNPNRDADTEALVRQFQQISTSN